MRTLKVQLELVEVKVCRIQLDLLNLENYMSKFLALKNHERNTREILEVVGMNGSNYVNVTFLLDQDEDENKEVQRCQDFAVQFGKITCKPAIETAFIYEKAWDFNSMLDYNDFFVLD